MGGIYSLGKNLEEKEDTPVQVMRHKRLVSLDPRSPSEGIARTPIFVDKTPRAAEKDTSNESLKDPRSPTHDFQRTPLPCLASVLGDTERARVKQAGPRIDVEDSLVGDQWCESESGLESAGLTPVLQSIHDITGDSTDLQDSSHSDDNSEMQDSPVSDVSLEEEIMSLSDRGDSLQGSPDFRDMTPILIDANTPKSTVASVINKRPGIFAAISDQTPNCSVIRCNPAFKGNKKLGTLSRSPLTMVDNSPRALSYRASLNNKIALSVSSTEVDKENIFHSS